MLAMCEQHPTVRFPLRHVQYQDSIPSDLSCLLSVWLSGTSLVTRARDAEGSVVIYFQQSHEIEMYTLISMSYRGLFSMCIKKVCRPTNTMYTAQADK